MNSEGRDVLESTGEYIARLRAEIERLRQGLAEAQNAIATLERFQTLADSYMAEIERLRAALKRARGQLITLGGDSCEPDCDQIQCAVLKEIETALHRTGAEQTDVVASHKTGAKSLK